MIKERDTAIDFVKLVATLLVMNSHMAISYGNYSFMASGGGIGNALFFFASGFTLFLGRDSSFIEWFRRRIKRIYPSLIAVAIIGAVFFGWSDSVLDIILAKRYWFIQCILTLYPLLFLVRRYCRRQVLLFLILGFGIMLLFPFIYDGKGLFYGGEYYRWAVYSLFMLLGAILGKLRRKLPDMSLWVVVLTLVISLASWYLIVYFFKNSWIQVLSVIPLFLIPLCFYYLGRCEMIKNLYNKEAVGRILISIGSLCLECYLIQKLIITDRLNSIFPLNIPFLMLVIILFSYFVRVFANLISQLFDSTPFNLKSLLKLY